MTLRMQRGEHNIEDELIFTNHDGYIFHDSRGFESGGERELRIVQDFVRRKSREGRLNDALHAIWSAPFDRLCKFQIDKGPLFRYCVPMESARPSLDLKYFEDICPDKNGTSKHNFMNSD